MVHMHAKWFGKAPSCHFNIWLEVNCLGHLHLQGPRASKVDSRSKVASLAKRFCTRLPYDMERPWLCCEPLGQLKA